MNSIAKGMYPKGKKPLNNFKQLELWLGHNLLVNTLAAEGKIGGIGDGRHRVFDRNIVNKDWKLFETL
jgi:hypothetical protein